MSLLGRVFSKTWLFKWTGYERPEKQDQGEGRGLDAEGLTERRERCKEAVDLLRDTQGTR